MSETAKSNYAFISYSTKNQSAANAVKDFLQNNGIDTWMAPGDIPAGQKYAQIINQAIKNSSCFVLLLTNDSQNSIWVSKETERAVNYRIPIIPVMLESLALNDEFELYISTDQLVAVPKLDINSKEMETLLKGVQAYTDPKNTVNTSNLFKNTNPESNIQIGSLINGKYKIINQIDKYGPTSLYYAEQIFTKEWFILRITDKRNEPRQVLERLYRESHNLIHLDHPGLVSTIDIIDNPDCYITVSRYVNGDTLNQIISNGAPDETFVTNIFNQLCDSLQYLHSQSPSVVGIRLRPKKIVLSPDGRAIIIDLGISCDDNKINGDIPIGETFFTAPELFQGKADCRTDIYSLGMIIYSLITGKDPSEPPYTLLSLEVNSEISNDLKKIVKKCIEENPDNRYQSVEELQKALNKYSSHKEGFLSKLFKK